MNVRKEAARQLLSVAILMLHETLCIFKAVYMGGLELKVDLISRLESRTLTAYYTLMVS